MNMHPLGVRQERCLQFIRVCGLALAISAVAFAQAPVEPPARPVPPPGVERVPTPVLYRAFFGHVEFLEKSADQLESQGQDGSELRNYYKDSLDLSDRDVALLKQHAARAQAERRRITQRINDVVEEGRARFAPEPPQELFDLFEEKDAAALSEIAILAAALGNEEYQKVDQYIRRDFAKNVTYVAASPVPPLTPPDPTKVPMVGGGSDEAACRPGPDQSAVASIGGRCPSGRFDRDPYWDYVDERSQRP